MPYIVRNGKNFGPFATENLIAFAQNGKLFQDDLILLDSGKSARAGDIKELKGIFDFQNLSPQNVPVPKNEVPDDDRTIVKKILAKKTGLAYYKKFGDKVGPVDVDDLQTLVDAGEISPTTVIWIGKKSCPA